LSNKNVQEAYYRFLWNVYNIFDSKTVNPYLLDGEGDFTAKERIAIEDFFHSLVNLPVEYLRYKGFSHPQRWVKIPLYILTATILLAIIF
jgi:hypothetical protein